MSAVASSAAKFAVLGLFGLKFDTAVNAGAKHIEPPFHVFDLSYQYITTAKMATANSVEGVA
jgi:hypothetical protein